MVKMREQRFPVPNLSTKSSGVSRRHPLLPSHDHRGPERGLHASTCDRTPMTGTPAADARGAGPTFDSRCRTRGCISAFSSAQARASAWSEQPDSAKPTWAAAVSPLPGPEPCTVSSQRSRSGVLPSAHLQIPDLGVGVLRSDGGLGGLPAGRQGSGSRRSRMRS